MSYSKGIMWLDDCRIPILDEKILMKSYETNAMDIWYNKDKSKRQPDTIKTDGRFTPNLLVCDDMLNDGNVSNSSGGKGEATKNSLDRTDIGFGYKKLDDAPGLGGYGDKGTNSRYYDLDLWFEKMLERL